MKIRKGTVLIQTLVGLTLCCGALGYGGYSSVSHSNADTYIAQDTIQTNTYQEIISNSTNALPLLFIWSNAECSATLQENSLLIPFPQTLQSIKTICEGAMTVSSPMKSFSTEAKFTFTPNHKAIQDSPTYETDELSIWAGQPELGYFNDVEWGVVARIYDGNIYMFLQIGDGTRTVQFQQVPLHKVDGEYHTYSCTLSSTSTDNINSVTLQCIVDNNAPVFINLTCSDLAIPANYGLVAKSMRVSPSPISLAASLLVTQLEYAP